MSRYYRVQEICLPSDPISKFKQDLQDHGFAKIEFFRIEERKAKQIYDDLMEYGKYIAKLHNKPIWCEVKIEL